jgi:hypothetical protein
MYGEDIDWCYRFHQCGEQIVFFAEAGAIHYGGASSSNAPVRFYLEMCRAEMQLWQKHRGWAGRTVFLVILAIHHSLRLFGWGCTYLFLPSQRPKTLLKLRRSLAILKWMVTPKSRTSAGAPPTTANHESSAA